MFNVHLAEGYPLPSETLKAVNEKLSNDIVIGELHDNSSLQNQLKIEKPIPQLKERLNDHSLQLRLYENMLHEVIKAEIHGVLTIACDPSIRERLLELLHTCELGQTFIDKNSNNLFKLLHETAFRFSRYLHSEAEEKYFHWDIPEMLNDIILTYEQKYELLFFLRECLNNIRKHSEFTYASIRAMYTPTNDRVILCVEDNGVGIPHQLGLSKDVLNLRSDTFATFLEQLDSYRRCGIVELYRKTLEIKGQLEIYSCCNTGTTITLSFPLNP
ncbi:ATP-binding protein [Haliscomenobacter sp.]|uniref:ATP-binding protein n=1 Tax=Haliscomenobacter sp. TaxID=2717303 RepID=UPI003BA85A0B